MGTNFLLERFKLNKKTKKNKGRDWQQAIGMGLWGQFSVDFGDISPLPSNSRKYLVDDKQWLCYKQGCGSAINLMRIRNRLRIQLFTSMRIRSRIFNSRRMRNKILIKCWDSSTTGPPFWASKPLVWVSKASEFLLSCGSGSSFSL